MRRLPLAPASRMCPLTGAGGWWARRRSPGHHGGRRPVARHALGFTVAVAVIFLGAAPAAPPEHPVKFIHVDALKALMDQGTKVDIIDVRRWDAYVKSHIKGARSMPLRSVNERAHEITKTGVAVFY